MEKLDDYQKYLSLLSKVKLFEEIPIEHHPQIFNFLQVSVLSFEKDELIQRLGEPLLHSGIVLEGTMEGSFINENYSKINMSGAACPCSFQQNLNTNLPRILASQNVFSNLKLGIANQKSLRDRILIYLHSLTPDSETSFFRTQKNAQLFYQ